MTCRRRRRGRASLENAKRKGKTKMGNDTMERKQAAPLGRFRPVQAFYHPNGMGSGAAIKMELHPAHDDVDGSIMLRIANQCAVGSREGASPTYARFDWQNAICVKLDFNDLCKVLQVFRGECESIDGDHGLYHQTARAVTKIQLRHLVEPVSSYSLEVYRNSREGGSGSHGHFILTSAEATGVSEAIAGSMSVICFGIPMLVPHDTSAYEARERGFRNASAA